MRSYFINRLLSLIPVLFIVSIVIFMIIHLTPGDPAAMLLGEEATEQQIQDLRFPTAKHIGTLPAKS